MKLKELKAKENAQTSKEVVLTHWCLYRRRNLRTFMGIHHHGDSLSLTMDHREKIVPQNSPRRGLHPSFC